MALISSSKCAMLRAIMALAWVDGKVTDDERARLIDFLDTTQYISDVQRASLKSHLTDNLDMDIDELWEQITEKEDRAQLIDVALSIFHADGDFSSTERTVYEKLFQSHMTSLDLVGLKKDLSQMAAEAKERLKQEEADYIASFKNDGGFPIPGINKVEFLLYKLNKFLGNA